MDPILQTRGCSIELLELICLGQGPLWFRGRCWHWNGGRCIGSGRRAGVSSQADTNSEILGNASRKVSLFRWIISRVPLMMVAQNQILATFYHLTVLTQYLFQYSTEGLAHCSNDNDCSSPGMPPSFLCQCLQKLSIKSNIYNC